MWRPPPPCRMLCCIVHQACFLAMARRGLAELWLLPGHGGSDHPRPARELSLWAAAMRMRQQARVQLASFLASPHSFCEACPKRECMHTCGGASVFVAYAAGECAGCIHQAILHAGCWHHVRLTSRRPIIIARHFRARGHAVVQLWALGGTAACRATLCMGRGGTAHVPAHHAVS